MRRKMVPVAPLSMLLDFIGQKTIDYWVLDVEGAEIPILNTFNFSRYEVGVLQAEKNKGGHFPSAFRKIMSINGFVKVAKTIQDDIWFNPVYFRRRSLSLPSSNQSQLLRRFPAYADSRYYQRTANRA